MKNFRRIRWPFLAAALLLGACPASRPAPAVDGWRIFRGDEGLTGASPGKLGDKPELLWKFKTGGPVKSSPVIAGGRVFVGSDDGNVYALALADGARLWAFKTHDAVEAAPLAAGGLIYVGSADANFYCLDADGKLRWKFKTGDRILGSANFLTPAGGRGARIVVGSYDNKLYCLQADKGKLVWSYESDNWINGSPAVAEGRIVFGGCDQKIHVVSAADGKAIRIIDAGSYIAASAALARDEIYIGHYQGKLLRADAATGEIVWSYGDGESAFFSSPALAGDRVVVGCDDQSVHCVRRKDGRRLWTFATGDAVESSPVVCDGKVIFGSDDGRLYILALADGRKLWSHDIGGRIASSPAVAGGIIVVGCEDGFIYAFGRRREDIRKSP